ncbi:thiopeptide-type bacteriocin biosynthesis protein [Frankia sp. AgB1.9]|uniref:thiopeptide-type bacteriocin biosynthesis protein n=1 Tax=unclassified Frankia TaxID=2632575 RepID=UPI0019327535|nr:MULTISPECIES: thiopeptide-type bacteriocin biosynthesis protein [unclassified Frankia]MBL7489076.1 thiopeptide-type bacteriocin biosynthesis protein [Frankia sp. AgW1.1]MBL7552809.1 thiopeptide-type bacteriocin biosynthesis protein [Frankia sp. AgB1.9]MBL7625385.1 thiopeptide-type bacteriocin biosynthesis protein [Frankia sp. AgB1.8]
MDLLAATPPEQLVDAVNAVLAGGPVPDVAELHGLPQEVVRAALAAYHEAGRAALTRPALRWYTTRLMFADQRRAEQIMAAIVGPVLDTLHLNGAPVDWWYARREGDWRVHLRHPDPAALGVFLHDLGRGRPVAATQPQVHEPDLRPFGGLSGTTIAYDLFVAESHALLAYARRLNSPLARRDLSIAVLDVLLTAAGLRPHARGGVYTQVGAKLAPRRASEPDGIHQLGADLHHRLLRDPHLHTTIEGRWAQAAATAGTQLAATATAGLLTGDLSDVLVAVIRAHWSRLGLSATAQAVLAYAAHDAYGRC